MTRLTRDFYLQDTLTLARQLLGKRLVHELDGDRLVVEITETEAYTGVADKACHAYGGRRTARTETMYLPGGHAYIYLIYGMYYLFNVVSEAADNPCAVLVRGALPVQGADSIARRRTGKEYAALTPRQRRTLLDGPGKLCAGLGLTKVHNALDLTGDQLYLCEGEDVAFAIGTGKRIGVEYAGAAADLPYRFFRLGPDGQPPDKR